LNLAVGFQPTVRAREECRVASATLDSGVADATRDALPSFPGVARRAKLRSPLRGYKIAALLFSLPDRESLHHAGLPDQAQAFGQRLAKDANSIATTRRNVFAQLFEQSFGHTYLVQPNQRRPARVAFNVTMRVVRLRP